MATEYPYKLRWFCSYVHRLAINVLHHMSATKPSAERGIRTPASLPTQALKARALPG